MTTSADPTQDRLRSLLKARIDAARAKPATVPAIPRRSAPEQPGPLSSVQARLWFLSQLEPDSPAYNVPVVLRLRGQLDTTAFVESTSELLDRHEVLRSVVREDAGQPVAVVQPTSSVPQQVEDLSGAPDADAILARRLHEEATRPFALDSECPVRVVHFRLGADEHVLALTLHHMAADAWSYGLLADDLARLYAARLGTGNAPALPTLQYADVAAWEASGRPGAGRHVDWWVDRLAGLPPLLDLPTDRPRRDQTNWPAGMLPVELPPELAAQVRAVGRAQGCTPFMVLLAALHALLARISGTEDVAVGVPEAGRRHPDTEQVVGCFVNTLVMRGDLSGEPTGRALLERTRDTVLDAFAHADASFDQVVERIGPARTLGVTPLFQVLLNVIDRPRGSVRFPDLEAAVEDTFTGTAKFDLNLGLTDDGEMISGGLMYRRDLFDESTVTRLAGWYLALLRGMLADLDAPVAAVPLEPAGAAAPVAGPPRDYPLDQPLHALVERWATRQPDALAVVGYDGRLSYAELDRRANQIAHRLLARGVRPGEPVAVLAERGVELIAAVLGVLKAGGCYVPLDPAYPDERIVGVLEVCQARMVLVQGELADRVSPAERIVLDDPTQWTDRPVERPQVTVSSEDLAYVIFTSGSTGQPKGVAVEHRNIVHYVHAVLDHLGDAAAQAGSYGLISTFAADLGLTNVFGALASGATLHVVDRETATDPEAFAAYLTANPIDVVKCVPSHLELLGAHGDLAGLLPRRALILAGEACPWSLVDRINAARPDLVVEVHYGPTETTVSVQAHATATTPPQHRTGVVPLGRPLPNAVARVVDPAGRPVPHGITGELVIGGPSVARGYFARPELTAQRFVPDPVTGAGRCYLTGDRVRVNPDGVVEFLGRVDDQVKIRGFRVEPGEVAVALRDCPGVAEAAVVPVGEAHNRRLAAWVVAADGGTVDLTEVRAVLRTRLPDYMVPTSIGVLDALPITPNGKLDRAALPDPAPEQRRASEPPSTPTELRVAAAWQEVLDVEQVGVDDDFFGLGGDSFRALRATRAIDPQLRVIELFTHPTVRELATFLDRQDSTQDGALLHRLGGPALGAPAEATVVCVPYGGGAAAVYQPLAQALSTTNPRMRVLALEPPGHDPTRPDEPFLPMDILIDRCAEEITRTVTGPVLVYGHCVGTATAVALAQRLESDGVTLTGVVLGGSFPNARLPGRLSTLVNRLIPSDRWVSDRNYRDLLKVAGGLFEEDGDDRFAQTAMASLRHDVRQSEGWFSRELAEGVTAPLRAPVLCVIGERDRGTELYQERYREWSAFAERVELATIPHAAHYFLKHQAAALAELISSRWAAWSAGTLPPRLDSGDDAATGAGGKGLRAFYVVALGQLISMTGSALSAFALGVWAFQESGRAFDYALVTMLALLPAILLSPLGGAVADRYDRRKVMLTADGVSGLAMAALVALLWADRLAFWHVCVIVCVTSLVIAFHRPAYLAAIAQLVPKPYLPQANALAQLGLGIGTLIAPLAGGALIPLIGLSAVIGLDVVSFTLGVVSLLLVRFPNRMFHRREETFRAAIVGGWRFITRRRPLVVMIIFFMVENYLSLVPLAVLAPLVLALGDAKALGLVTAAGGLGAAVGTVAMVVWGGTQRRATGMIGFVVGVGVGILLMGAAPSVAVVGAGVFLWWMSTSMLNAHWLSIIQVKVGTELQGRVLAMNQMMAVSMTPLTFLTAPLLADVFEPLLERGGPLAGTVGRVVGVGDGRGVAFMLVVTGALLVAWAVLGLRYRPLRYMEDELPDMIVGAEVADDLDAVQADADRVLATAAR